MKSYMYLNLLLALVFLPAAIAFPIQSIILLETNTPALENSMPEILRGIPGATFAWWNAVQKDLHLSAQGVTKQMAYISNLPSNPNWIGDSNVEGHVYGYSVGTAGDVNGDGYDDIIVGIPHYEYGEIDEGAAAVYLGSASGLSLVANWLDEGDQANGHFGASVGTAGDVNGDGFDDIIVGAPLYSLGQEEEGAAAVYHGSASGLSPIPNWIGQSNKAWSAYGSSVSTAGDVNGDGFDDVIVGSPRYENPLSREGAAAVYHGSASGLSIVANWLDESDQEGAEYGRAVGTAGDVNGDGFDDIIVGAPYYSHGQISEGVAVVYYGSASGLSVTINWMGESNQASAEYGRAVGTAGDVNDDGYDDIIVGAPIFNHGQDSEGAAAVYTGSTIGLSQTPVWTDEGDREEAQFGYAVGTAGDVNGDGFSDIIIGARFYNNGQYQEGAAAVYTGSTTGLSLTPVWTDEGDQEEAQYGYAVGTAGDVNDDGFSDIIIGSPLYSHGQYQEGAAAVYHGSGYYYTRLPLTLRNP